MKEAKHEKVYDSFIKRFKNTQNQTMRLEIKIMVETGRKLIGHWYRSVSSSGLWLHGCVYFVKTHVAVHFYFMHFVCTIKSLF